MKAKIYILSYWKSTVVMYRGKESVTIQIFMDPTVERLQRETP